MTWVAVGSGIVAIVGGIAGSAGEAKKRKGIRKLNTLNAARLETQAKLVERQTEEDLVLLRQRLTKVVGSQRAAWGASGLSGDSGSALDVMSENITAGINDQRRRREQGDIAAADLRYSAKVGDLSARAAIEGSQAAGNVSLLQGVGQAASYYKPTTKPAVKV